MLLFDIGANRGDATVAGLAQGYDVIACEPASIFGELVKNFIYDPRVTPLKIAISDSDYQTITFYEAEEDGLSTMNKEWLTNPAMPYNGKPYKEITALTMTIDTLAKKYGEPDLIKIDVEGSEWSVFRGMSKPYPMTFEWTYATIGEHREQLRYLASLGYTQVAPRFIEAHLRQPDNWIALKDFDFSRWHLFNAPYWEKEGWREAGLRPTADVGMCWIR